MRNAKWSDTHTLVRRVILWMLLGVALPKEYSCHIASMRFPHRVVETGVNVVTGRGGRGKEGPRAFTLFEAKENRKTSGE